MDECSVWSRACVQVSRPCCSLNSIRESCGCPRGILSHISSLFPLLWMPVEATSHWRCDSYPLPLFIFSEALWKSSQAWILPSLSQSSWFSGLQKDGKSDKGLQRKLCRKGAKGARGGWEPLSDLPFKFLPRLTCLTTPCFHSALGCHSVHAKTKRSQRNVILIRIW